MASQEPRPTSSFTKFLLGGRRPKAPASACGQPSCDHAFLGGASHHTVSIQDLDDLETDAMVGANECLNPIFKRAYFRLADAANHLRLLQEAERRSTCE